MKYEVLQSKSHQVKTQFYMTSTNYPVLSFNNIHVIYYAKRLATIVK